MQDIFACCLNYAAEHNPHRCVLHPAPCDVGGGGEGMCPELQGARCMERKGRGEQLVLHSSILKKVCVSRVCQHGQREEKKG